MTFTMYKESVGNV